MSAERHSKIGSRMKDNYESVTKFKLTKRIPVIIRLDMRSGHTFTKGLDKPFDEAFTAAMQEATQYLCEHCEGAKFGYSQSDEISVLLTDYDKQTTEPFFDYGVQKLASVTASMATLVFNKAFREKIAAMKESGADTDKYERVADKAMFDSRCFNIPKEEVVNYFIWRQLDAERNSIQAIARHYFNHKQLSGKSGNDMRKMLEDGGISIMDYPETSRIGICCMKYNRIVNGVERHKWEIAPKTPRFLLNKSMFDYWI